MLIQSRSYQSEAVGAIYNYFATKQGNPLVAMPTGTGKSVVIAMFLESIFRAYPNQRVLVLTHVKELIEQNYDKLKTVWPNAPAGINSAGLGRNDFLHPIIFAGIASVAKKAMYFGHVDLVLIDEAHLLSPNENTMYQKFLSELMKINPDYSFDMHLMRLPFRNPADAAPIVEGLVRAGLAQVPPARVPATPEV